MTTRLNSVRALLSDDTGAALAEYGLLVALIAAICIISIKSIGTKVSTAFASLESNMP